MWHSTEDILSILGRDRRLFDADLTRHADELARQVQASSFLVLGGAGTIGQAVVKEIFQRNPKRLHVVDISENNLVELVRDIRSSYGYIEGDFRTLPLDCGSPQFQAMFQSEPPYDYVLNLSALKHVRSEKDPYTLMRMIEVNILNTESTLELAAASGAKKYFGVSSDKAVRPTNAMGASKRVMELCLMRASSKVPVSTARFANVAFSDGSLLHGFIQRIHKKQPLAAPQDVQRYFITPEESGQLCLMSCLLGENRDLLFPKLVDQFQLTRFDTICRRFLDRLGLEPVPCETEEQARRCVKELAAKKQWPCFFFNSDTTGEKDYEEFYTDDDILDLERFQNFGVVKNPEFQEEDSLKEFFDFVRWLLKSGHWTRQDILNALQKIVTDFSHRETNKFLDNRM
ncbi:MAG: UDP-N-acetylglucosamine 4,6-dehydratase [Pirellulales bacterium]|nr:UDP-N-acetylglucosamine 4,6-dehydratase [Pirellulales bacterium]